jgi:hypothetical protein
MGCRIILFGILIRMRSLEMRKSGQSVKARLRLELCCVFF